MNSKSFWKPLRGSENSPDGKKSRNIAGSFLYRNRHTGMDSLFKRFLWNFWRKKFRVIFKRIFRCLLCCSGTIWLHVWFDQNGWQKGWDVERNHFSSLPTVGKKFAHRFISQVTKHLPSHVSAHFWNVSGCWAWRLRADIATLQYLLANVYLPRNDNCHCKQMKW